MQHEKLLQLGALAKDFANGAETEKSTLVVIGCAPDGENETNLAVVAGTPSDLITVLANALSRSEQLVSLFKAALLMAPVLKDDCNCANCVERRKNIN